MADSGELVIDSSGVDAQYWADLWSYRELLYLLAWRDVVVRYKQTALGVLWALLQPFLTMLVFTLIFGRVAKLPSGGVPYPLMVFAGLLPWLFFSQAVAGAANSLLGNSGLVSKIYFPRLLVPAAAITTSFMDLAVSAFLMVGLMLYFGFLPDVRILFLPAFLILALASATGAGVWFAALTVKYRDFRFVVPFALQLGLFLSPVGFATAVIPEKYRLLYALNPMVSVIDGFRWALLRGSAQFFLPGFLVSTAVVALVLLTGLRYFRNTERSIADLI